MLKQSIWQSDVSLPAFDPLNSDLRTDVLIIGGGIAGILCAYMLSKRGVDCVVAEAENICSGITRNTTAKITLQHGLIYHKLLKRFGHERTQMYLAQIRPHLTPTAICAVALTAILNPPITTSIPGMTGAFSTRSLLRFGAFRYRLNLSEIFRCRCMRKVLSASRIRCSFTR